MGQNGTHNYSYKRDKTVPKLTSEISEAVDSLIRGKLVAFPGTVYGLGGDATNEDAVNESKVKEDLQIAPYLHVWI